MLNYIWLGLIVCAVIVGGVTGNMANVTKFAFDKAGAAVMDIGLPLVGIMALWLGIMRLAEKSGMVQILARLLRPLLTFLFPDVPPDHPAMGSMLMNMAANMLGLSNAATPLGLRAMEDLESLNPRPGTATNAMCTFLTINTSSIQLIPVTAVGILAVNKSANPSCIIFPAFLASIIAAISAIIVVKFLEKLPMFRLPPITAEELKAKAAEKRVEKEAAGTGLKLQPLEWWGVLIIFLYFAFFLGIAIAWLGWPDSLPAVPFDPAKDGWFVRTVNVISALSIPILLSFFPLYAALRRIKVYEEFVEGAKEGFQVIIRIIPNLVAMLVAIGMFRGAGCIDLLTAKLGPLLHAISFPPELLSLAIIRPLSGSGTIGAFTDIVLKYGGDSFISRTAAVMQGSSETTFYVLAVYFGSVGIKRTRHAVPAGLTADVVSLIASVVICKLVFG